MNIQFLLLTVSTILAIISPLTYIISIAKGNTKPHRITRFILAFVVALNLASILSVQSNLGAIIFAGVVFIQGIIIFAMSLWRGMGGTTLFDWSCLLVAIIGVIGWKLTGDPVIGLWFSILADFVAYLPAFIKTWKYPDTESPWFYLLGALSVTLSLMAYKIDISSGFQIYIGVASLVMLFIIYRKKTLKFYRKLIN